VTLDQQRFETVRHTYARMSDEELALLLATRRNGLTDEARAALNDVMAERDLLDFEAELQSVRTGLARHDRHADMLARNGVRRRQANRMMPVACVLLAAAGACLIAADAATPGYASVVLGVLLYAAYRARGNARLIWLVLRAGVRPDRPKK